jgi:hypothetical protein
VIKFSNFLLQEEHTSDLSGKTFYHGTSRELKHFDLAYLRTGADKDAGSWYGDGIYLSGEPWKGSSYAYSYDDGVVLLVKAKVKNPFIIHGTGAVDMINALKAANLDADLMRNSMALTKSLAALGHDSILVLKNGTNTINELVVFDPKHATITGHVPVGEFKAKSHPTAKL